MIVFRGLQGFLGGSMIPTVFTTAFFYFTGQQRVIAAAVIGTISSLAPTLGPTIGGWITDNYSWHWLFFINLIPGTFVAVVVPMLVRVDRPDLKLLRGADYLGMALMAIFLGCLEYTLEEGPRWDWFGDGTIRATAWSSRGSASSGSSSTLMRGGRRRCRTRSARGLRRCCLCSTDGRSPP